MEWDFFQIQAWSSYNEFLTLLFLSFKLAAHCQQLCYMMLWSTLIDAVLRYLAKFFNILEVFCHVLLSIQLITCFGSCPISCFYNLSVLCISFGLVPDMLRFFILWNQHMITASCLQIGLWDFIAHSVLLYIILLSTWDSLVYFVMMVILMLFSF